MSRTLLRVTNRIHERVPASHPRDSVRDGFSKSMYVRKGGVSAMPTATVQPAPIAGSAVEDDEMFDLDLHITESGSVAQEAAAAATENCVLTDNCSHSRHCHH